MVIFLNISKTVNIFENILMDKIAILRAFSSYPINIKYIVNENLQNMV